MTHALRQLCSDAILARFGEVVPWRTLAWGNVIVYATAMLHTFLTVPAIPVGVAFGGASKLEIADARAAFLVDRTGNEGLLRSGGLFFHVGLALLLPETVRRMPRAGRRSGV